MSDISNFKFNGHGIRVVTIDGSPWFVATDVCRVLEMAVAKGTGQWLITLADDEKWRARRDDLPELFSGSYAPSTTLISESGLYKLILRSNKPQAKPFQDWVTKEVLPAIRKDGAYIRDEEKLRTGEMTEDEFLAKAFAILQAKVDRVTAERDAERARADTAEGKQEEMRTVFAKAEHSVSRFARTLDGVNANLVKRSLELLGYLYRKGGTYRVYREHYELFKERVDTTYGSVEIFPTAKGKEKLTELYGAGMLIMKVGWSV